MSRPCLRSCFKHGTKGLRWSSLKLVGCCCCTVVMYFRRVLTARSRLRRRKSSKSTWDKKCIIVIIPNVIIVRVLVCSMFWFWNWLYVGYRPCKRHVIVKHVLCLILCSWKESSANTRWAFVPCIYNLRQFVCVLLVWRTTSVWFKSFKGMLRITGYWRWYGWKGFLYVKRALVYVSSASSALFAASFLWSVFLRQTDFFSRYKRNWVLRKGNLLDIAASKTSHQKKI